MGTVGILVITLATLTADPVEVLDIGGRLELLCDRFLIDRLENARLVLHEPRDEGIAFAFDAPWEGKFCGYATMIKDGDRFRCYYRGMPAAGRDGSEGEVTCVAESADGVSWSKPKLKQFEYQGSKDNNIVLAGAVPFSHNFSVFIDERPDCPREERFKALAGTSESGLCIFSSADGYLWRRHFPEAVITKQMVPYPWMFDSQNLAFWSTSEGKYVAYFRVGKDDIRRIARSESADLKTWSPTVLMEYRHEGKPAPIEHLYTSQTHPYFRAPHLYVAIAARFMPGRQVLSDAEAQSLGVDPGYFKDTSDAVFMTTRGGNLYDRECLEGFIRPGLGHRNWVSRTNYPALNVLPTSPMQMSFFVNQDYAQPTAHLRRYSMRIDGFSSLQAPYGGGEMITKPIRFSGRELALNFATSAAGGMRVAILDASGEPMAGYSLEDCRELIGNEIERVVAWKNNSDISALAGKPIRLRLVMKDADLYSLRFRE